MWSEDELEEQVSRAKKKDAKTKQEQRDAEAAEKKDKEKKEKEKTREDLLASHVFKFVKGDAPTCTFLASEVTGITEPPERVKRDRHLEHNVVGRYAASHGMQCRCVGEQRLFTLWLPRVSPTTVDPLQRALEEAKLAAEFDVGLTTVRSSNTPAKGELPLFGFYLSSTRAATQQTASAAHQQRRSAPAPAPALAPAPAPAPAAQQQPETKDLVGLTKVTGITSAVVLTWRINAHFFQERFEHLLNDNVDCLLVHSEVAALLLDLLRVNVRLVALDPTHRDGAEHMSVKKPMHHSKGFILFSDACVRVIVSTANLSRNDCGGDMLSNAWWYEDFPRKMIKSSHDALPKSEFENTLATYLESILGCTKRSDPDMKKVKDRLDKMGKDKKGFLHELAQYDYSRPSARLVISVPRKTGTGAAMLPRLMRPLGDTKNMVLTAQSSSIGAQDLGQAHREGRPQFLSDVLAKAMGQPLATPDNFRVVWPTTTYCSKCRHQPVHYNPNDDERPALEPFLRRYEEAGEYASRANYAPHLKTYSGQTPGKDKRALEWCILTSANITQAAWGSGNVPPNNYELGVYFGPGLEKTKGRVFVTHAHAPCDANEIVLPLGYRLDAEKYRLDAEMFGTLDEPAGAKKFGPAMLRRSAERERRFRKKEKKRLRALQQQ